MFGVNEKIFNVNNIHFDFEISVHNAFRNEFNGVNINDVDFIFRRL